MDFVEIALPIGLNTTFTYSIPEIYHSNIYIGKRVVVNFNGRKIMGYIVNNSVFTEKYKIKPIDKIVDTEAVFTEKMITFARWVSEYYFSSLGEALSLMVPRGIKPKYAAQPDNNLLPANQLSPVQQKIYDSINDDIANGQKKFYIYGITGSGKTEIYFQLIDQTIRSGKKVIFLVPEIALSYQTMERMQKRFGSQCANLHSNLTGSIKLGEYFRLLNGDASIAIGPRSALFAPLDDIGLIIIDEEHEGAYKSEESPRFHSRSAAMFLANLHNSLLVLGSATPSVESWFYAEKGFFKLYEITERFGGAVLPDVSVIDTNTLSFNKNLSLELTNEINNRLQNKEQILLLQNRRGFSNYLQCNECKTTLTCPKCSISLTYHKTTGKLVCHRCGYAIKPPDTCPECGGLKLNKIGAGTQKIEEEIQHIFPHARVVRIDYDVISKSKDLKNIFKKIEDREIDIIIGTQMIAKGLHFPGIKFVGIVNADIFLNIPDFKAAERAFSLITQVSGRAGRTGEKGLVMIQTINPTHYSITTSLKGDFESFYTNEIAFRDMLNMPPFTRMIRLVVRGSDETKVKEEISRISDMIGKQKNQTVEILGPTPCMITKINLNFRYQMLLKSKKIDPVQSLVKKLLESYKPSHTTYLEIDVDPTDLF
ncbi:MAG: primosomal protein N' [Spirochaetes bacterium GWF1_31_7]|nr:MAG: primosomal protein N' [Spirochaetes bacterium GWE1_32_154]OHD50154.1 MAG: primosomal protein N' [Spirochaetes bacterium GWE2_31_10]OHD52468.1 MAG: primosomal protein N' [Spirochaetes bacterium GWF1_31_7]HBI38625.1 primosomal protein N' [Spirochaetia bacterium]